MSKLNKALKTLFISPSKLLYIWRMKRSGLFDRQFYLSANPLIHKVFHYMPERHYALMGEQAGLYPNPDFSPHAYLRHNHDVASGGMAPFDHYLRIGRYEERLTKDLPGDWTENTVTVPALRDPSIGQAPYAIIVHMYYHDLWDEFREKLGTLDTEFDLYVTITERKGEDAEGLADWVRDAYPQARVLLMPNHGRDIFPFVHLVNAGWLDGYEAVCKLHTKKSPHRQDGDHWRRHLINGILPGPGTRELAERFVADPEAGFWVADGQHYNDAQWWGSNFTMVAQLLHRVELTPDRDRLSFPAGSIYWLKPRVIDMIRGLQLRADTFEPERGQTDGTLAHAIERALGMLAESGGLKILQTTQLQELKPAPALSKPAYVSTFYLPQFHPVPENDAWWGKGFTEWTSVTRAQTQFSGHVQPMLPADLGFYDLRVTEVMGQQAEMARSAGIDAFCVYHYWFDGQRILEKPVDQLLERPEIDFPFYLCWANESWRRNWDGLSGEVLMPQSYESGFAAELAQSLVPYFNDLRYQRPDGIRPRFIIYRPEDMPAPTEAVAEMRTAWREAGIGEVELGAVLFHIEGKSPVPADLFDFWVEMPPHGLVKSEDYLFGGSEGNVMQAGVNPSFSGLIYDYDKVRQNSLSQFYARSLPRHTIAGIMPCWDNTARRGAAAHIAYGANPVRFDQWLRGMLARRVPSSYRNELFINAWNEWAEKAMLEPSEQYRSAYLSVLRTYL